MYSPRTVMTVNVKGMVIAQKIQISFAVVIFELDASQSKKGIEKTAC